MTIYIDGVVNKWKGMDTSYIDFSYEHKTHCVNCQSGGNDATGDNLHVYGISGDSKYLGAHCFACGFSIPSEENLLDGKEYVRGERTVTLTQKDLEKLDSKRFSKQELVEMSNDTNAKLLRPYRGLDAEVCEELGVRWKYDEADGKVSEMWFPATVMEDGELVTTGYKVRKKPKDFYSKGYVGKANLFAGQTNAIGETLVIVGGEIDLVSATQMLEGLKKYHKSVTVISSMLGEDSTADVIKQNYQYVAKHKKIILCLDNDDAGKKATQKCIEVLPKDILYTANLRYKDPNEYLKNKDAASFLQDCFWNATPVEDDGIIGSGQLYEFGLEAARDQGIVIPFHMSDLAPYVPMFMYDSIILLVGSTSIGKTANLDATMLSIVMSAKEKAAVLSLEASRKKFAQKIASRVVGTPLNRLSEEKQIELQVRYKDAIQNVYYNENGEHRFMFADSDFDSIAEAEKVITKLIKVHGCKIVIADPLQNIIGNKTNDEQRGFMLFCERMKKKHGVMFLFGTHTRKASSGEKSGSDGSVQKEDSIEGSGSISKSASLIITLSRNKNATDWVERNTTYYSVPKNRDFELTGELVAKSFYRSSCSRLYPYSYAEQHNFFRDDVNGDIIEDDIGFVLSSEDFDEIMDNSEVGSITKAVKQAETTLNHVDF